MGGPIHSLLAVEHRHLEQTLREATADAERIDLRRIRIQHGAITALLAPPPSPTILRALNTILGDHDALEEMSGDGLYALCEGLVIGRTDEVLNRLRAAPEVPLSPHTHAPGLTDSVRRILARAGYDLASFEISTPARAASR